MPELTVSPKRILSLDALRGLAAILVVVHHLPIYFDISVAQDYVRAIKNLQLMVDLFFVISGFILTDVYISKINRPSDAISFCARRISRLYPLHFLSMVAVGLLALHATGQVQALISGAYSNDFRNFMLNLTLTQKVGLETSWSFNTPSWSISTEFWVNLLFAGIIVLLGKKYLGRASVTLTFFSTLVLLFLCKGWISAPKFAHLDAAVFRTMAGFFAGVLVYHIHIVRPTWLRGSVCSIIALISVLLMAFTLIISDGNIFLEAFIAIFLCPLIVLAVVEIPGIENFASAGPIRWLGEISFSIYLWQLPLAILARDIGIERISENKAVVGITYMLALVVISSLSLWYYEMPMRNVINALWASVMRRHRQVR